MRFNSNSVVVSEKPRTDLLTFSAELGRSDLRTPGDRDPTKFRDWQELEFKFGHLIECDIFIYHYS